MDDAYLDTSLLLLRMAARRLLSEGNPQILEPVNRIHEALTLASRFQSPGVCLLKLDQLLGSESLYTAFRQVLQSAIDLARAGVATRAVELNRELRSMGMREDYFRDQVPDDVATAIELICALVQPGGATASPS